MKFLLAFLVFLAAAPVWSKPDFTPLNRPPSTTGGTLRFAASDFADSVAIGVGGFCTVRFEQAGGDDVSLYAITTQSTAATSGTLLKAFSASTSPSNPAYTFTASTQWVKAVAVDATAGGSILIIECNPVFGSSGGGSADPDGDGLYDFATLWDADGDGSTWVTCTAKDTPDSACKAAGERIYGDTADDLNCAIWGCGVGQMENAGTIYLEQGVYINWPCWEPTNTTNTRGAANESEHDATGDAAYSLCPASPDPNTTRRLGTIALMDWQGEIIGAGTDTRDPATTGGYLRDQGTYLVDDRGPTWLQGAQDNLNSWWGQNDFVRGFNFGFNTGGVGTANAGDFANAGEYAGDGDSTGYGLVSGTQLVDAMNAQICVCEDIACGAKVDNWAQGLVAGDVVEIAGTSSTSASLSSPTVIAALRVRTVPDGTTCNGAGTTLITLGGSVSGANNTNANYAGADVPYITQVTAGMQVVHSRSDTFDSTARIANMNIEPQDYWDESGGDCAGTGLWSYSADGAQADFDCDTEPLFGIWGGGAPIIEDVVVRFWHDFAFDGNSNIGNPLVRRVRLMYGRGGPVFDYGTGWNFRDIEVRNSQFANDIASAYGPGVEVDTLKLYNVRANKIASFSDHATHNVWKTIRVNNSSIGNLFYFDCGSRFNYIEDIHYNNVYGIGTAQLNGVVARFGCSTTTNPIESNTIADVTLTGSGLAAFNSTSNNSLAAVVLDTDPTVANPDTTAIVRNRFQNFTMKMTEGSATYEACLFGVQDESGNSWGGAYAHEAVLGLNTFFGNSVMNATGSDFVYCGCATQDGTPPSDGANSCDEAIRGGAGGGTNARGCMNSDQTADPTLDTCT
jgi:hypothetical protein